MSDMTNADRRTVLAAMGGTVLLGTIGRPAQAQEVKPEMHGISITEENMPKSSDLKRPEKLQKTDDIEVLDYELLGGPTVFHGQVWVDKKENDNTFTYGEVAKGPMGGLFEGNYYLTKTEPNWYKVNGRNGLWVQLYLGKDHGWVWYRYGRKRLVVGWVWYPWERPLVAW